MSYQLSYQRELDFFTGYISNLNISYHIFTSEDSVFHFVDTALRDTLGITKESVEDWRIHFERIITPNKIVYITDEFYCQYITILLPEHDNAVLSIGPYLTTTLPADRLLEIMEQKAIPPHWLTTLKNYYPKVPCIAYEEAFLTSVTTFADFIFGKNNYSSESVLHGLPASFEPLAIPIDTQKRMDAFSNIEAIEHLYSLESELLQAVSHGRSAKAKQLFAAFPLFSLEKRTETIRNCQNYSIVLNTLLRKASEQGGVHPIYIHQLSDTFARKIEATTRADLFVDLWLDMVQKYCQLVNKHSIKNYSLPIQKVITRIDFDLSADLSLSTTASVLNINASYLSNLFRTETGYTLTDYVNLKRMDHAAYLLASTHLPVSTIAQTCGILDDNYFTKLFKRYHHKTPSRFRQDHSII